jgi:hypothetical protein
VAHDLALEDRVSDAQVTVEALLDRARILDCMNRYARGMDRLDRALVPSTLSARAAAVMGAGVARDRSDVSYARPLDVVPKS